MTDDRLAGLDARVQALSRAREHLICRLNSLQADHETLVAPNPERTTDDQLTRPRKVRCVREALVRKAITRNGKAKLDYRDVQWLFDGHPSPGHAYDLMQLAGESAGFRYEESDAQSNRVVVDRDAVHDPALVRAANNTRDDEEE